MVNFHITCLFNFIANMPFIEKLPLLSVDLRPLSLWHKTIGDWCRKARPEDLLCVDIFFGFALAYGDTHPPTTSDYGIMGCAARQPVLKSLVR